jgi:hypothetical protein
MSIQHCGPKNIDLQKHIVNPNPLFFFFSQIHVSKSALLPPFQCHRDEFPINSQSDNNVYHLGAKKDGAVGDRGKWVI